MSWVSCASHRPYRPRNTHRHHHVASFFVHWAITALSLWVVSKIFYGIKFANTSDLIVSALLLGFANALVKPILIVLTFPLTLLTLGLFLLVINALMIMLVSWLVRGFTVSGFWTALFASIFMALLSAFLDGFLLSSASHPDVIRMPSTGAWI